MNNINIFPCAALDLCNKLNVDVLIGGQTGFEQKLLAEFGGKAKLPVISLSNQVSSTSNKITPFFVNMVEPGISQFEVMASMAEAFNWKDVLLIYDDSDTGRDVTFLIDSFKEKYVNVIHKREIASSFTDGDISYELHKVLMLHSRIIVVHSSQQLLLSRLLLIAKTVGLMNEGYAWFLSETTTNILHCVDHSTVDSMQGLIGLKRYIPSSKGLHNLTSRIRRKIYIEDPNMELLELSFSAIRAYDTIWALAQAIERVHTVTPRSNKPIIYGNRVDQVDLRQCKPSRDGSLFLKEILQSRFMGLSGQFQFLNGKLLVDDKFEIVNFVGIGHRRVGLLNDRKEHLGRFLSSHGSVKAIVWPGGSTTIPESHSKLQSRAKLRIVVPDKNNDFKEFVFVEQDVSSKSYNVTGFCIDVFKAAVSLLPYQIDFEFIPFRRDGLYNEIIMEVFLENYDAAVGDITILSNRSRYVDFTQPFSDIGVGILIREEKSGMWVIFMPFSATLWVAIAGFFLLLGFVVWVMEHTNNGRFQGFYMEQIGNAIWFAFSTITVFHNEELKNYASKFVVVVWVFLVLILTSTYTATLSSMMTVKRIQLDRETSYIGYQSGSFVARPGVINNLDFKRLNPLHSAQEFADALSKGSRNGGVSAIIDEIPYIKLFLSQYGTDKYSMIKTSSTTSGFGFAFKKGSPLVQDLSKAIETLRETKELENLERLWFHNQASLLSDDSSENPNAIDVETFRGLFILAGAAFATGLISFSVVLLAQNRKKVITYISEVFTRLLMRLTY